MGTKEGSFSLFFLPYFSLMLFNTTQSSTSLRKEAFIKWGIQLGLDILALVGRVPELSSLRAEEPLEKMAFYKEIRLNKMGIT